VTVYLVKHWKGVRYAADNGRLPRTTDHPDKAFRWKTHAEAAAARDRMPLPAAWVVVEAVFRDGRVVLT
jgi:hypothetical protein